MSLFTFGHATLPTSTRRSHLTAIGATATSKNVEAAKILGSKIKTLDEAAKILNEADSIRQEGYALTRKFGVVDKWAGLTGSIKIWLDTLGKRHTELAQKIAIARAKKQTAPDTLLANQVGLAIVQANQAFTEIDGMTKNTGIMSWITAYSDAFRTAVAGILSIPLTIIEEALKGIQKSVMAPLKDTSWDIFKLALPLAAVAGIGIFLLSKGRKAVSPI